MAQPILIWERQIPHFPLCVLLAALWEDLDPVVFPVLFLVKWSWLCKQLLTPYIP